MIFTQAIERNAHLKANQLATCYGERQHTWKEFSDRIAKLASGFIEAGITPGERIAILALNSDRYAEYYYACAWAGAVMVPLNTRWSISENQYAFNDSGATMLVVDDHYLGMVEDILLASPKIPVVYIGEEDTPTSMIGYQEIMAANTAIPAFASEPTDLLGIFYTGGTTGFPKGVMLSNQNVWTSALSLIPALDLGKTKETVMLIAGPMFHCAAGAMTWSSVIDGITMSIIPGFTPDGVLKAIEKDNVTDMLLVPTMISMLLADPKLNDYDLSSLKQIIYGASPMPEGTLLEGMKRLPNVGFCQAYGQTEMAPVCSVLPPEFHNQICIESGRIRSVGRPTQIIQLAIKDDEGNDLPDGSVGEICIKGPNVMMGYWNKPEQTKAAIVNGWLHSGDAGYLDENGFIFLVDRVKDMIISGGENVFSAEVESTVSKHPAVHEVAVIGIPSEQWGEAVHAIVRLKPGQLATENEIVEFCREHIAGYKIPRSIEFREAAFPITGAGKVQKNVLREAHWKDHERSIG